MKRQINIPAELADIAPAYLASRVRDVHGLKDALNRKDYDFILKLSHKTKGTAASYGFKELGAIAKTLEIAAKSGNFTEIETTLSAMQNYLESIEIAP